MHYTGESILLKENLVSQLKKSQEQYTIMKHFYETKLLYLTNDLNNKQLEREELLVSYNNLILTKGKIYIYIPVCMLYTSYNVTYIALKYFI